MAGDFCILHLSDIHFKSIDDPIVPLSGEIAKSIFHEARETGFCLIMISGDVAYSGRPEEYEVAALFLNDLRDAIENEGCGFVEILVVPGNHDCALEQNDSARDILVDHIVKAGKVNLDTNIVGTCTKAQQAFFDFRALVSRAQPVYDHELWTEYELNIEGKIVRISALNAAWMSRNPEVNGELVFPVEPFQPQFGSDCDIRIAMLHHPLHWYDSTSFHSLRSTLHLHSDLLISGHEHTQTTVQSEIVETGQCTVIECAALQPHGSSGNPEFLTLRFDEQNDALVQSCFSISDYAEIHAPTVTEIPTKIGRRSGAGARLVSSFQESLRDPGGSFIHPRKTNLTIDDIFVFPLAIDRMRPGQDEVSTELLIRNSDPRRRVLFMADEKAGKSTLLRWTFREWHVQGYLPVYIRGLEIRTKKEENFRRAISRAIKSQYADPNLFETAPIEKRMILIDDIDLLSGGRAALHPLIEYCDKHFSRIFVTATTGYEYSELLDDGAPEALSSFDVFSLPTFGHKMRRRLIKKWCGSTTARNDREIEGPVHQVETIVNSVIGNNLVPAQPIFLLILLQSIDQRHEQDLHHSGLAHYYHYLITKGLGSAGTNPEEIDEIFNYLANLAWLFQSAETIEISEDEFIDFNRMFSDKYVSVDFVDRRDALIKAKLLIHINGKYSFAYPYTRYFFIGKYLAENSENQEVQRLVDQYCESLHLRDRASCILFLMHHRNDLSVVDKISSRLALYFDTHQPLDIGKDTRSLNALIDVSTELLLGDVDVEANQEKERELRDRYELATADDEELSISEEADAVMSESVRIMSVIKTAEILGQVLKNYYGSIERGKKAYLIENVFDGPLRMLRFLVEGVIDDPENFANELHRQIRKNKPEEMEMPSERQTRMFAFNMIGMICTGVIGRTAGLVSSEKLEEDFEKLTTDHESISYRMIVAAIKLMRPGRIDISHINSLGKDIRDNPFAFRVLQSFGFYRLRMFYTDEPETQRLCAALQISRKNQGELRGPKKQGDLSPRGPQH